MELKNKHKILYYYATGAFILLLLLKFFSSKFFEDVVDFSITFLPFIIILSTVALGVVRYKKHPENLEEIKKKALHETLYLLLITLLFYILYSPGSFEPIVVSVKKMGQLFSMENYFLVLSYVSVGIVAFSLMYVFIKLYQKSKGTFAGTIRDVAHHALYSVFFILAFLFVSSIITYPRAYAPVTGLISNVIYRVFYTGDKVAEVDPRVDSKVKSLKNIISDTFNNLKSNVSTTNETLVTTITETKTTLDNAISRTNKDLKTQLSDDIEERLDLSGGTLSGNLTIEDKLTVEDTSTLQDVLPNTDDTYDLGSVSKGWNNVYIHTLHGSSILTVGDSSTSHGMSDSDDLLVSGDLEVNGAAHFDGNIGIGSLSGILKATSGIVGLATESDYQVPLTFSNSLSRSSNDVTLVNDNATPGVSKYYGTDTSGVKGWQTVSAGTTDHAALLSNLAFATSGHTGFQAELTFSAPLVNTTNTISLDYNTTNLRLVDTELNTIQNIADTSSPSFAGLTIDNINLDTSTINNTSGDINITAAGGDIRFDNDNVITTGTLAGATLNTGQGDNELYDMDQNVQTTDAVTFATVNTGQGAYELYAMDQNVLTTSAPTFATLNTGQGAYELYAMDQNVLTTSSPTFAGVTAASLTGGTLTSSDLVLKTTTGVAASGADMLFQTGSNGLTEAMKIDYNGVTYVNALQSGAQAFPDDAGVTQWVDLGVTTATATAGTVESYSAMLDGAAVLTVYGTAGAATGTITDDTIGVGIGTTTPGAMLHVYDDKATDYVAEFYNDGNNANRYGLKVQTGEDTPAGTNIYMQMFDGDGGNIGYIQSVAGATPVFAAPSDISLKTNIEDASFSGLSVINNLRVREFNWKNNPSGAKMTGFIAQEAASAYPDMVTEMGNGLLGVMRENLIPVFVKAVQEQQGQISTIVTDNTSQATDINGLILKTDTNATTVAGLQASVDEQLGVISDQLADNRDEVDDNKTKINELAAQIASIEANTDAGIIAKIQEQMKTIQEEYQALMGSVIALNLENLIYKDSLGNVDLLEGKLITKETETGKLTIAVADEASATIGVGEIAAGKKETEVATSAVTEDSKIFVTFKSDLRGRSWYVPEAGIKSDESFTVAVSDKALEGTIALTADSTTVAGTKTSFTTDLAVGDKIAIGEDSYEVEEVTSDTELVLTEKYEGVDAEGLRAEALSGKDLKFDWWIVGVDEAAATE